MMHLESSHHGSVGDHGSRGKVSFASAASLETLQQRIEALHRSVQEDVVASMQDLASKQEELLQRLPGDLSSYRFRDTGRNFFRSDFGRSLHRDPNRDRDRERDRDRDHDRDSRASYGIHNSGTAKASSPAHPPFQHCEMEVEEFVSESQTLKLMDDNEISKADSYGHLPDRPSGTSDGIRNSGGKVSHFVTAFDSELRALAVTIVSAQGLRSISSTKKADPYCICQIADKEESRMHTKVVYNTLSPVWNHETILHQYEQGDDIEFWVATRGFRDEEPLGYFRLAASALESGKFSGEVALEGLGAKAHARLSLKVEWKTGEDAKHFRQKVARKQRRLSMQIMDEKDGVGLAKLWQTSGSSLGAGVGFPAHLGELFGRARKWLHRVSSEAQTIKVQRLQGWIRRPAYDSLRSFLLLVDAGVAVWETQHASRVLNFVDNSGSVDGIQDLGAIFALTWTLFIFFFADFFLRLLAGLHPYPVWSFFNGFAVLSLMLEVIAYHALWNDRSDSMFRFWATFVGKLRVFRLLQFVQVTSIGKAFLEDVLLIMRSVRGTLRTTACCLFMTLFFLLCGGFIFVEGALHTCVNNNFQKTHCTDELRDSFGSLSRSVFSLFMAISGGDDWIRIYEALSPLNWTYHLFFLGFVFYSVFAFMSVVIAVVVESMMESSRSDKKRMVREELRAKSAFVRNMEKIFETIDQSSHGEIILEQLQEHMQDTETCAYFAALGVDAKQVSQLFQLLDEDASGTVSRDEFLRGCIHLRGNAKGIDTAILMRQMDFLLDHVELLTDAVDPFAEKDTPITTTTGIERVRSVRTQKSMRSQHHRPQAVARKPTSLRSPAQGPNSEAAVLTSIVSPITATCLPHVPTDH